MYEYVVCCIHPHCSPLREFHFLIYFSVTYLARRCVYCWADCILCSTLLMTMTMAKRKCEWHASKQCYKNADCSNGTMRMPELRPMIEIALSIQFACNFHGFIEWVDVSGCVVRVHAEACGTFVVCVMPRMSDKPNRFMVCTCLKPEKAPSRTCTQSVIIPISAERSGTLWNVCVF